jgi:hypothetical protein
LRLFCRKDGNHNTRPDPFISPYNWIFTGQVFQMSAQ